MTKRLYISADIEGVAGVATIEQLTPSGFEYQQAREWMTDEVTAACEAAFDGGIEEIVISDSHGNGQNLLLDKLPDNVQVVRSWPRPLCMMEGIQHGEYIGAMLLGYHTGANEMRGVLAHTLHSKGITQVKLNGETASETTICAATAAHYGVPVILVSGDDAYTEHAKSVLGDIEAVTTKWACSLTSARMLQPKQARHKVRAGVATALSRLHEFKVPSTPEQIELDVQCMKRYAAELLDYLPCVERLDAHNIRFITSDMVAVSKFLAFLLFSGILTAQ